MGSSASNEGAQWSGKRKRLFLNWDMHDANQFPLAAIRQALEERHITVEHNVAATHHADMGAEAVERWRRVLARCLTGMLRVCIW